MKNHLSNKDRLKRLRTILKEMNEVDYRVIQLSLQLSDSARSLIRKYHVGKKEFCEKMQIKEEDYKSFINGAYDYDMMNMASLQATYCELEAKRHDEEVAQKLKTEFVSVKTD